METTDLRTEFTKETKTRFNTEWLAYNDYVDWLEQRLVKLLPIQHISNSEVFEHYGKPFTSGRDLWDFLTAHYNFTPKT